MIVTFMGTSSGTPSMTRNVSGITFQPTGSKHWYLVDCGEATQHQIQKSHLSPMHLEAIFITHVHGDHCYGLPGLLSSMAMMGRKKPLTIVAPKGVEQLFHAVQTHTELFITYPIQWLDMAAPDFNYQDKFAQVIPITLSHRTDSYAYLFKQERTQTKINIEKCRRDAIPQGQVWSRILKTDTVTLDDGKVIQCEDYRQTQTIKRNFIISGDNDQPKLLKKAFDYVEELTGIIHEATYTEDILLKVGPKVQHSSALRIAQVAEEIGLPNLFLTHFSPRFRETSNKPGELSIADIGQEASNVYGGNLILAADLTPYQLNADGIFSPMEQ